MIPSSSICPRSAVGKALLDLPSMMRHEPLLPMPRRPLKGRRIRTAGTSRNLAVVNLEYYDPEIFIFEMPDCCHV